MGDSDDLKDLDMLFEYVAQETDTLIALCSKSLLHRPWCVGELATACDSGVPTLRLTMPDFDPPDIDFIQSYCSVVPDTEKLAEHGVTPDMIVRALLWFQDTSAVPLASTLSDEALAATTDGLLKLSGIASASPNLSQNLSKSLGVDYHGQNLSVIIVQRSRRPHRDYCSR